MFHDVEVRGAGPAEGVISIRHRSFSQRKIAAKFEATGRPAT